MSKYYSIITNISSSNGREWFVGEFKETDSFKREHEKCGLRFETKEDCEKEILKRVERFKGTYRGEYRGSSIGYLTWRVLDGV